MASKKVNLVADVWHDIKQHFLVYLLAVVVVASAFGVIFYAHLNRQATIELEELLTQRDELDIERRNLLLEQNSLAEHSAIEVKAERLLKMKRPSVKSEILIRVP